MNSEIMSKQPDWTIIYFKNFWDLVENGLVPSEAEESELDWALPSFLDFWDMATMEENDVEAQEQEDDDLESAPESGTESDDSSEDGFISLDMDHLAKMWVLKAEQRYLLRTLEIQAQILDDQDRRIKEHKKSIKARTLERKRLARWRQKMEIERGHRILGSFVQFWANIERQEPNNDGPDILEDAGDFFRLFSI